MLVPGFLTLSEGLNLRPDHVGFEVDKVGLRLLFLRVLRPSHVSFIILVLHA